MNNPVSNVYKALTGAGSYRGLQPFLKRGGAVGLGIAAAGLVYVAFKKWRDR